MIASGSRDQDDPDGPAGPVWAVYGAAQAQARADSARWRVRLAELPERGPREHWPSLLDRPLTEAAMATPTVHELRYGMTADQMQARGLDPATGKPTRQRRDAPEWDDYDPDDEPDEETGQTARRDDRGDQADADAPIVRGVDRRTPGRAEPPQWTPSDQPAELIDLDSGRPIGPPARPSREPHGPQGQPWPTPRRSR